MILVILIYLTVAVTYLVTLMVAGVVGRKNAPVLVPKNRFLVVIPAHNEEAVLPYSLRAVQELNYPAELMEIHLIADHCTDRTANFATQQGIIVHVRNTGQRGNKSVAMRWFWDRVREERFDALVILDADAKPDKDLLQWMNAQLETGFNAVQGQQIISNPESGWYAKLAAAMYQIENVIYNQGRFSLGGSAKHMGDCIALRKSLIESLGFGEGLTEDHYLRTHIVLAGDRIAYEPRAIAYNEAAQSWEHAKVQRVRWMQGTFSADRYHRVRLFGAAWKHQTAALLEAVIDSCIPSFSILAAMVTVVWIYCVAAGIWVAWSTGLFLVMALFPFLTLALSRAPKWMYSGLLSGPFFILWRTFMTFRLKLFPKETHWVRTPHGNQT